MSYDFTGGAFRVLPVAVALPEVPVRIAFMGVSILCVIAPVLYVGRLRTQLDRSRLEAHLGLWQLRQLAPEEPLRR
jgi:hypothetical protein